MYLTATFLAWYMLFNKCRMTWKLKSLIDMYKHICSAVLYVWTIWITWLVSYKWHELRTLREHLGSPLCFCGSKILIILVFCVVYCVLCVQYCQWLLWIVLSLLFFLFSLTFIYNCWKGFNWTLEDGAW